jgi:hypothetical protein
MMAKTSVGARALMILDTAWPTHSIPISTAKK